MFKGRKGYGWPDQIAYGEPGQLVASLRERGVKAFEISSSFGLTGFVLAAAMEIRGREGKAVME